MDNPDKTAVYGSLNDLNQATATILRSLYQLQEQGIVSAQIIQLARLRAEELRAVVNHSLVINMAKIELEDAARYAQQIKELPEE